jgi:hypothetical protein
MEPEDAKSSEIRPRGPGRIQRFEAGERVLAIRQSVTGECGRHQPPQPPPGAPFPIEPSTKNLTSGEKET